MLLYADPTRDVYVAEYVSEPMLALGAAFAWYQDKFDPLAKCILPHFREMVAHELIRLPSRGVDEIVARIVFLMAMDFAAVNPTERALSSSRRYNGHLTSLRVFLQALSGESFRAIRWTRHGTERDRSSDAEAFVRKWDDWLLGFTQFIQLPRLPTPTVLRVLLERRAAGVFPSSNRSVDWVIPIAKDWPDGEVSMLLVRVEHHLDDDAELNDDEDEMVARHRIQTALRRLRPSSVWAKEPQNGSTRRTFCVSTLTCVTADVGHSRFCTRDVSYTTPSQPKRVSRCVCVVGHGGEAKGCPTMGSCEKM
ncbi:hypothetical protein Poli38472_002722 [Pythium oligandrum]|uniref:Uncharacterized protein n=1 Tax=Pythium oligandrum TaxID=41045 RepID=A0A8K1FIF8_PYTOL|nr:hypothetical protein Poli38472_002722 [Pythium oligandrum]|eukprot:TMW63781.1 hypothetical protein Poli38472_002722 [Pythium oligandrum]